jgi:hypothetical protein
VGQTGVVCGTDGSARRRYWSAAQTGNRSVSQTGQPAGAGVDLIARSGACSRIQARTRSYEAVPVEQVKAWAVRCAHVLQRFVPPEKLQAAIRALDETDRPRAPIEDAEGPERA